MKTDIFVVTPFERPDVILCARVYDAGAFPVLHLGRDLERATKALEGLSKKIGGPFGVCAVNETMLKADLPKQVTKVILPWGLSLPKGVKAEPVWQIHSAEEGAAAIAKKAKSLILKGSEGAGLCGEMSSFMLFQQLADPCKKAGVALYIQGGVGVHTAAAYLTLGAKGVVIDSQTALFPECGISTELKTSLSRLNGSEIHTSEGFHYYVKPGARDIGSENAHGAGEKNSGNKNKGAKASDDRPKGGYSTGIKSLTEQITADPDGDYLPLGQDIVLATDYSKRYKYIKHLVRAIDQAARSHPKLARAQDFLLSGSKMSVYTGTPLPIAQGPMARISDVPEFLRDVAEGGALPYLAMSMLSGEAAENVLNETVKVMEGKSWGVGILGFMQASHPDVFDEQVRLVLKAKPSVVLIGGGRPSQVHLFEKEGIKAFLHAPVAGLLDMFLKEGTKNFIFEGRESGGHVGPLASSVLWEHQINHLMSAEGASDLGVFFAGGIHDALSAAFVRVMAAPLAARGVKIGIQMGTAYLYTDEIVKRKAITEDYRKMIIENDTTLLLKSGNGQESRGVPSPFTDFFLSEKKRMEEEGLDSTDILLKLEDLNLGRLRIAAKGVARRDGKLISLTRKEQIEEGFFMTGSMTTFLNKKMTISAIHKAVTDGSRALLEKAGVPEEPARTADHEGIAVVGMSCIFPDAENIDEYWRNILFGKNSVTEVPPIRWSPDIFFDPDTKDTDHVVSKWGGFIDAVDFDALEFGITPQSLAAIEPVQLLSLLSSKRALEDAGYTDLSLVDLDDTSVIFGTYGSGELTSSYGSRSGMRHFFGDLPEEIDAILPRLTEDSFPGVLSNVIAGRISNRLNTGGRNYTVDAACASSLAALDVAVSELNSGKSNMVVLGGADLHNSINDFLMFSSTHALSKKGHCSTFDADADGIALGEGIGVLILKRLSDAERDGNKIYAVIKGIGGSSDGRSLGLTAPGKTGQIRALERAYDSAGVEPSEVGYLEAHGTGTVVGDRTELSALTDVFLNSGAMPGQTRLGSVKTQIGHTKCAAGVAGLIKAILCVQHGLLPPTLHLSTPNDAWHENGPFSFKAEKTGYWHGDRRIAGVSGFGFGGTNFHTIVENYVAERPQIPLKSWPSELFVFRGDTEDEAKELLEKTKALLDVNDKLRLKDIAFSLASYNEKKVQIVIVASSREELLIRLGAALAGVDETGVYPVKPIEGKTAFLFSGQGSQRVNMAADLFMLFPQMRKILDAHPEYEEILYPDSVFTDEAQKMQRATITDTRNAQPLLGIVDFAIAELLRDFGVKADMVAGHSYGEIPALCFAGAFDEDVLADLSRSRANAILGAVGEDPGRMAAVQTEAEALTPLLKDEKNVWAVNFNAPKQTVIAGTSDGVGAFLEKLKAEKISYSELNVACAFHTPLLAKAEKTFAADLKEVSFKKPKLQVWSNTTAEPYPQTATSIKKRLAEHLVSPVRFREEADGMYADGARVFIEAGPGGTLTGLVSRILKEKEDVVTIQTERGDREGLTLLLFALAQYISTGREIDMEKVFENRDVEKLNIDEPEQHKKNGTVWNVDGQAALPENGVLPAHAGTITMTPVMSLKNFQAAYGGANVESIMMAYLDNINSVIQDQRDVMLGYLGAGASPRAAAAPRQFVMAQGEAPALPVPAAGVVDMESATGAASVEGGEGDLPNLLDMTTEEISDVILHVVSEKTGYPVDMLGLDVDLEAELSIDSIKKMEIVGGLRDRVKFPISNDEMEESFDKMIAIKTLREMTVWVEGLGDIATEKGESGKASGKFEGATAAAGVASPSGKASDDIVRMTLKTMLLPTATKDGETVGSILDGKIFAITDDGNGLTASVVKAMEDAGAVVKVVTGAEKADTKDCDGLIITNAAASANHYSMLDFFHLLKQCDMNKLQWICTFDDISGALMHSKKAKDLDLFGRIEGFSGFIKSLWHEYPGKHLVSVTSSDAFDKKTFPDIVLSELSNEKPFPEVFYEKNERYCFVPEIGAESEDSKAITGLNLDEDSNVIVLGGAQGITPNLVAQMAADCPCHYILVGRSAAVLESEAYEDLADKDAIRNYLIKEEGLKQPKEIENKVQAIHKTNQIRKSMALIEASGAKVSYHSVDVRDADDFRAFVKEMQKTHGKIDGVVHAAGILEDKLFRDKEAKSFERVYRTKVGPLEIILKELLPDLKLLVMFSSMSSSFGNAGQCDYAAGNSVMDIVSRALKQKKPGLKSIAFNWGPWRGAGMVNEGLENEFRKKGISLLRLDKGGEFFVNELMQDNDPGVLAIAGDREALDGFIKTTLQ